MTRYLLACGHVAESTDVYGRPGCPICAGLDPGARTVVSTPDLTKRRARCTYYGRGLVPGKNECDICKRGHPCQCERQSSLNLAFFEYKPDAEYDEFYCGCHSWN